jgi:hypothetical protein
MIYKREMTQKKYYLYIITLKSLVLLVSINGLLKLSTTIRNNRRDKGHPYLNPLRKLENIHIDPLISIANESKLTQLITQLKL